MKPIVYGQTLLVARFIRTSVTLVTLGCISFMDQTMLLQITLIHIALLADVTLVLPANTTFVRHKYNIIYT